MASKTDICNLALQKLGAKRITSIDDSNSKNARECNAVFNIVRDRELRKNTWNFSKKRAKLAPSATAPNTSDFDYAFPKPSDCLRIIRGKYDTDWEFEGNSILTNLTDELELKYVAKITDTAQYDSLFVDALACAIGMQLCETITGSNSKYANIEAEYKDAISEAKLTNGIENSPIESEEDSWVSVRYQ